ncbi:SDR family oxidoreductase [Vibrio navarrensis]
MEIKHALILVTNAGSLLGRTIALHFAKLGATIILSDQNKAQLAETQKMLATITDKACSIAICDDQTETIQRLFAEIEQQFAQVPDVLVNCWTSLPLPSLTGHAADGGFVEQLSSTAGALYRFGQVCAERMRQTETKGVIVNVITHADHQNFSGVESVTSLVSGFTHSWAKELTPFNIRVGGVIPALSHTQNHVDESHWAQVQDELIRNTEYIVANEYFSGRVVSAEV